jgi:hypothetical protein
MMVWFESPAVSAPGQALEPPELELLELLEVLVPELLERPELLALEVLVPELVELPELLVLEVLVLVLPALELVELEALTPELVELEPVVAPFEPPAPPPPTAICGPWPHAASQSREAGRDIRLTVEVCGLSALIAYPPYEKKRMSSHP